MSVQPPSPPIKIPKAFTEDPEVFKFIQQLVNSNYQKWAERREGSFTPEIYDDSFSGSESQTYSVQTGYYYRIGDLVVFFGEVTMTSLGTLTTSQSAQLGNLPFPVKNLTSIRGGLTIHRASSLSITAGYSISGFIQPGQSYSTLRLWDSTGGQTDLTLAELTAAGSIAFAGSYLAE